MNSYKLVNKMEQKVNKCSNQNKFDPLCQLCPLYIYTIYYIRAFFHSQSRASKQWTMRTCSRTEARSVLIVESQGFNSEQP